MSTNLNKGAGPKKALPSRLAEAQKRAERITSGSSSGETVKDFLEGAWSELKKTTWPTREVLTKSTSVVLLLVVAVAVWVSVVDFVAKRLLDPIFGTSSG